MSRPIDADALSKDLEKRWNVNDDQDFCNKEVWYALEEAPTIESDGDTISRQALMKRISEEYHKYGDDYDALQILGDIEDFPSAETSTVSEKHQLSAETSTNTSTDLISIQMAIEHWGRSSGNLTNDQIAELQREIESLPSAPDSRQRGEWIFNPKDAIELMFTKPKCSKCGFESADGGNFCSNCGADMRGEK